MDEQYRLTLAEFELEPVVAIEATTSLSDAARLLLDSSLDTLLVATDPLSVLTEGDLVRAVAAGHPPTTPVAVIVSSHPAVLSRRSTVPEAVAHLLTSGRRSALVIDDDAHPLGLVTLSLVFTALLEGPPWLGGLKLALRIDRSAP